MSPIETFRKADINISTSGDNTIIAAPGDGKYIAIDFLQYMVTTAVTVQHKDGATNYGGAYPLAAQQAVTIENSMRNEHGVITLSNNSPFVMNLGGNVQTGGIIRYRVVGE